jgi:hypothetical protein
MRLLFGTARATTVLTDGARPLLFSNLYAKIFILFKKKVKEPPLIMIRQVEAKALFHFFLYFGPFYIEKVT